MRADQRGLTLIGFVMMLAIVGFFALLAIRLVPVYYEYYGVVTALNGLKAEPGIATQSPEQVRELLFRRFYTGYVTSVKPNHVRVQRSATGYNVTVSYEVRQPFLANLDFLASFERSAELARND